MVIQNILRRGDIEKITGLSRSQIYNLMAMEQFPRPIPLGPRAVGWLENEIADWQQRRIDERTASAPVPDGETGRALEAV